MKLHTLVYAALGACCSVQAVMAQTTTDVAAPQNIGQQVYQSVCIACHDTGVAHAPKFGDRSAWEPLVAEGQSAMRGWACALCPRVVAALT